MRHPLSFLFACVLAFCAAAPLVAQETAAPVAPVPVMTAGSGKKAAPTEAPPLTPQEVIKKMGILAYPLIALSCRRGAW